MIEIRPLNMNELKDAIDLKVKCWTEEFAGVFENTLDSHEELNFFTSWARSEKENADRRILLGLSQEINLKEPPSEALQKNMMA
ncbi:hypothetical protein [Proteiniclasticum sp.]|uniref:hypothetical protein n=1 Tax=Proteiniclasticum sp. TaxID=2053595 RepID=UPI002898A2BA|nr:hypothetical protein [Proteiniclasticum sp.]